MAEEQVLKVVPCSDCGGTVSRKAKMCPHCGRPFGGGPHYDVTVRDVEMRFGSMVALLVGLAVAAIPALLLLGLLGVAVFTFGGVLLTGRW